MDATFGGSNIVWFAAVVLGTVILGAVIAFAMTRSRRRTPAEDRASEARTREIYKSEDPGYTRR